MSGNQRAQVDVERALKNEFSIKLRDFIKDKKATFNDKQMIRAFLILNTHHAGSTQYLREELRQLILSNILAGKFEFN